MKNCYLSQDTVHRLFRRQVEPSRLNLAGSLQSTAGHRLAIIQIHQFDFIQTSWAWSASSSVIRSLSIALNLIARFSRLAACPQATMKADRKIDENPID